MSEWDAVLCLTSNIHRVSAHFRIFLLLGDDSFALLSPTVVLVLHRINVQETKLKISPLGFYLLDSEKHGGSVSFPSFPVSRARKT